MRCFVLASALWSGILFAAESPQEPLIPRIPGSAFDYTLADDYVPSRLVIKFVEGSGVRRLGGAFKADTDAADPSRLPESFETGDLPIELDRAERLLDTHPALGDPVSLFKADPKLLATLKTNGERATGRQQADLGLYFSIPVDAATSYGEVKDLLDQLNALASVEVAYAEPSAELATIYGAGQSLTTPDFMSLQGYLFAAPDGIDAPAAWNHNQGRGGRGDDVRVIDIEGAWFEGHEDFPGLFYRGGTETLNAYWEEHGTAVLGEMAGVDNGFGVHGIADKATYGTQSIFPNGVASAILSAAGAVEEGGILVLEVQAPGPWGASTCPCAFSQCGLIPVEYYQAEFDAIALATSNCVTVVEAAGNGSNDLDHFIYSGAFNRNLRDSGALLVGASMPYTRVPMCFSNQGSRLDFHAWGLWVTTTSRGDLWGTSPGDFYTAQFSGTSSATPIVAGAAAAIQGAQKGYGRPPLAPENMLFILKRGATPSVGGQIGVMPNLASAVFSLPMHPRVCGTYGEPMPDETPDQFP